MENFRTNSMSLERSSVLAILYKNSGHTRIDCFTNDDWDGSKIYRKSKTGYCVFVGGKFVSWSKKQSVVARFSAESEYKVWWLDPHVKLYEYIIYWNNLT